MAKDSYNSEDEMVYIVVKYEYDDEGDKRELISHINKNDTWIIDSGCQNHMTRDKTKFENMEYYDGGSVWFWNNEPCCIKWRSKILLTKEIVCNNAYWVEGLKHNLLSVAELIKIGFKVEFMHDKARLLDDKGKLIGSGK